MARNLERCSPVQPPDGDAGASRSAQRLRVLICTVINDEQAAAGPLPVRLCAVRACGPASCLMLWIIRLLTTSQEPAGNGRSRASASIRSIWSSAHRAVRSRLPACRVRWSTARRESGPGHDQRARPRSRRAARPAGPPRPVVVRRRQESWWYLPEALGLRGVLSWSCDVGAAGGGMPDQDARFRLLQPPPFGLLAPVVMAA